MGIILGAIAAIAAAATTVTKALAVAGLAVQGLKTIGNALVSLGKALGLIKNETKVEDLGDKAIQSEYNPEDFDSYAEYVKAVEEFDDLDPEKSKQISQEDKIQKGMELAAGATIEKYNDFPIQEFCIAVGKNSDFFTESKMGEIGKIIEADGENISSILNYVNGSEKDDLKIESVVDTLTAIEKVVNPNISDSDALRNVLNVRK